MKGFHLEPLRELADQLTRFSPGSRQAEQALNAEKLLGEILPGKVYPYQYLVWRLTGFRPSDRGRLMLAGKLVAADLDLLLRLLRNSLPSLPEVEPVEVLTQEELALRLAVSQRTLRRWQTLGLEGTRAVVDGKSRLLFNITEVERFVARNAARVERGARFERMEEDEKQSILRGAGRLVARGIPLLAASKVLARRFGRAVETMRALLKQHDRENPEQAFYPKRTGPLDERSKLEIFTQYRRGQPVETLARRYHRTRNTMYRVIHEVAAQRLVDQPLDLIGHASFDDKSLEEAILAPMPGAAEYEDRRESMKVPKDVPAELAPLYRVPLLNKEQEQHLFRKMNFLKHKALLLRDTFCSIADDGTRELDASRVRTTTVDKIHQLLAQANEVKELLINANMRLVVNIAKRGLSMGENLFERISDGNMSLIRAVEKFDFGRGFKFSTYASWAIIKNFSRTVPDELTRRDRFVTGQEDLLLLSENGRTDERSIMARQELMTESVNTLLAHLDPREREIIRMRAGIDSTRERGMTLEEIGNRFGITKERVRQLHARSMRKLRVLATDQALDIP
ncbi:MAG: sigma-70 family RNA polymerase sigma factor [Planctomycetota bacterium]|nr:sigma-70 family RNA polymerase sigma factor [Planctomycetota bacterium]